MRLKISKLFFSLMVIAGTLSVPAFAINLQPGFDTGPLAASQVTPSCQNWSKNLSCADNNQQAVDDVVDQLSSGGGGSGTVTSVAALTLGTTGTDLSSTVANSTTTPVITLQVPTASSLNRGALSSTDWSTFNGKQASLSILKGTLTDTDLCTYTASGTLLNCNTATSTFLASGGTAADSSKLNGQLASYYYPASNPNSYISSLSGACLADGSVACGTGQAQAFNKGIIDPGYTTVTAYGATGNGSTDDTTAIQNAINATPTNGTLYFPTPSVKYLISATLNLKSNITIVGNESEIYMNSCVAASYCTMFESAASASTATSNVTIRGLYLQSINNVTGSGQFLGANTSNVTGFSLFNTTNVHIENVYGDALNFGVLIGDGSYTQTHIYIKDSYFTTTGTAVYADTTTDLHIDNLYHTGLSSATSQLHTINTEASNNYVYVNNVYCNAVAGGCVQMNSESTGTPSAHFFLTNLHAYNTGWLLTIAASINDVHLTGFSAVGVPQLIYEGGTTISNIDMGNGYVALGKYIWKPQDGNATNVKIHDININASTVTASTPMIYGYGTNLEFYNINEYSIPAGSYIWYDDGTNTCTNCKMTNSNFSFSAQPTTSIISINDTGSSVTRFYNNTFTNPYTPRSYLLYAPAGTKSIIFAGNTLSGFTNIIDPGVDTATVDYNNILNSADVNNTALHGYTWFANNGINWSGMTNIPATGVNWTGLVGDSIGAVLTRTASGVNWSPMAGGGGGGVTNISTDASMTGGPITTTGTLAVNWSNMTQTNATGINWSAFYPTAGQNWTNITTLNGTQTITGAKTFNGAAQFIGGINWTAFGDLGKQSANWYDTTLIVRTRAQSCSTTTSANPAINTDYCSVYYLSAQAGTITSFTTNLTGTPNEGDELTVIILDNGTSQTITAWGSSFAATNGAALPAATNGSSTIPMFVKFKYSAVTGSGKWYCVAVS